MMKKLRGGFSLIESMIALSLIGIVLAVVVSGYEKVNRINLASGVYSERLELMSGVQRLTSEIAGGTSVTVPQISQLQLIRVDPTLNRQTNETRTRLPWPWPAPDQVPDPAPALFMDPYRDPFTVSWTYDWVANPESTGQLIRTTRPVGTNPTVVRQSMILNHVKSTKFSLDATDSRMLRIEIAPVTGSPFGVKIFLQVVHP